MTDSDRHKIQHVLDNANSTQTQRQRALILLHSAAGQPTNLIARGLEISSTTVSRVRRQFVDDGIDSVLDAIRGGANRKGELPRTISAEVAEEADALHQKGASFRELARKFDFSPEGIRLAIERRKESDEGLGR